MNNKLFTSLMLPMIAISMCSCSIFRATTEKSLSVYNLDKYSNSIEACKTGEVRARFNKNEGYVPYLSLRQYASLYESHYADGAVNSISRKDNLVSWSAIKDNGMYFFTQIDFEKKEVITAGSLEAVFKANDDPRDTASLYYGNKTEYDAKLLGTSVYSHYSFANQEIDYFSYMGDYYLPLSFFDITYSFDTTIYFYYNYNAIYSTINVDNFYQLEFQRGKDTYTVLSEMNRYRTDSTAPEYLVKLNSNLFLYLLDNFYGLKEYKGINSGAEYCKSIGTYDKLFSGDGPTRAQAYAETLDRLDDNHTALVSGSLIWGGQNTTPRQYGTGCLNRSALRGKLNRIRRDNTSESYRSTTEYQLSSDGKTAMLFFDEFVYGSTEEVFNDDGSIKETAKFHDSFYSLLDFFKEVEALGTVENVVFDMATNGGGVLGVLMKLLALISTENKGNLYYLEAASKQLGIAITSVDSDNNGAYNKSDCYGDDFNIYLLTSDCSFSCANAFPCLAQKQGFAKIIGEKSGGGECAVAIHYLPNGEYVYHSSNLHLGYYDEATEVFTGFEDGAQPDILVSDYNDFFNINKLSALIENA